VLALLGAFLYKMLAKDKTLPQAANPRSGYPIKGVRLYGSPDLFLRLRDNQGNIFVATCGRWGGILQGFGIIGAAVFLFLRAAFIALNAHLAFKLHAAVVNTVISVCGLFALVCVLIAAAGFLLDLIFQRKIFIYDRSGQIAYKILQKGLPLFKEEYLVADAKSAVQFKVSRKRFTLLRAWSVARAGGQIAQIKETGKTKALLRMAFGHLCGLLRADYAIAGRMDCRGDIISGNKLFTYFQTQIDKPEAIDSNTLLVTAALIYLRDRDKWHPWCN
jgi:hypothetical protein